MTTLFGLTLRLARKVTTVRQSTATAGDATSLTDSAMSGLGEWVDGTVWILSGDHAGKSRSILSNPKDKVTFATLGSALAGAERYAIADKHAPLDILKSAVTMALDYFRTESEDTSLTQDSAVEVYTIPAAVLATEGYDYLTQVELATLATDPYNWTLPHRYWMEQGTALRFPYEVRPLFNDCPMRLKYAHIPQLVDDDDVIPLDVNYNALYWRSLVELLTMMGDLRPREGRYENLMNEAQVEWQRVANNVKRPRRADPLALY